MQRIFDFLGIHFAGGSIPVGDLVETTFNMQLVSLSCVLAIIGSFVSLLCSRQVIVSKSRVERFSWLIAGAAAMSGGVWSMHFIGMMAMVTHAHMKFDSFLTTLSAFPIFFASLLVGYLLSQEKVAVVSVLVGGALLGVGVGVMHFIGMAAMNASMVTIYDPKMFGVSLVLAVGLAIVALGVKTYVGNLGSGRIRRWANFFGAIVMGVAISGMHYTAVGFAQFYHTSDTHEHGLAFDSSVLVMLVSGLMLVFMAIISLVAVARKINADKSLIDMIINNSKEGFLVCNSQGIVRLFSPGAEALFGWSADEVVGKSMQVILPMGMAVWHSKKVTEFALNGSNQAMLSDREIVAYTKDGEEFPLEIDVAKIGTGHDAIFCATMRDITVRKQMRQDQEKFSSELAASLEQQQAINQMQQDFVTMASHEFRTPLAIIDGGAQRILRKKDGISQEELTKRVERIRGAVKRMERLMESFLASAATEKGSMKIKYAEANLGEVITLICADLEISNPAYDISVDVAELPDFVQLDAELISQVVSSLVSNAVKYSPGQNSVEVRGWKSIGRVHVSVRDFGLGIPEEEIGKVTSRFYRASTSTGIPGTGLGLDLAQHIIDLHGGGLAIESEVGKGTTFIVTLPSCPITSVDGLIDLTVNEADGETKAIA